MIWLSVIPGAHMLANSYFIPVRAQASSRATAGARTPSNPGRGSGIPGATCPGPGSAHQWQRAFMCAEIYRQLVSRYIVLARRPIRGMPSTTKALEASTTFLYCQRSLQPLAPALGRTCGRWQSRYALPSRLQRSLDSIASSILLIADWRRGSVALDTTSV